MASEFKIKLTPPSTPTPLTPTRGRAYCFPLTTQMYLARKLDKNAFFSQTMSDIDMSDIESAMRQQTDSETENNRSRKIRTLERAASVDKMSDIPPKPRMNYEVEMRLMGSGINRAPLKKAISMDTVDDSDEPRVNKIIQERMEAKKKMKNQKDGVKTAKSGYLDFSMTSL